MQSLENVKSAQPFSRLPLPNDERNDAGQSSAENSRRKPIGQSFGRGKDQRRLRFLLDTGILEPMRVVRFLAIR